jgi:hypothetical protein
MTALEKVLRQAQTNSLRFPPQLGTATIEAFKDPLVVFRRNAFSVIFDPQPQTRGWRLVMRRRLGRKGNRINLQPDDI